jgi:alpha-1,2-mannosyltransferase
LNEFRYSHQMADGNEAFIRGFSGAASLISLGILYLVFNGSGIINSYLIDSQNYIAGRDFVNFWQYGVAAWEESPEKFYDPYWYNARLDLLTPGQDYPDQLWSYPPHFMLMMAPFGLASYNIALVIFTLAGLFIWWGIAAKPFVNRSANLALFTSPFLVICLVSGQLSLFLAAIFVWLYRNLDTKPVLSGLLIALLTVKPHLGILIPLFLIFTQRWKVFASAAIVSLAFIGLSLLIHGVEVWQAYFDLGLKYQAQILNGSTTLVDGLMPTALMNMVVAGIGSSLAIFIHTIFALAALSWFCIVVLKSKDHFIQFAALLVATYILSPYMMAYDFIILIWVMIMLTYRKPFDQFQKMTFRLIVFLPVISVLMAQMAMPGSAIIPVLLAFWIWKCRHDQPFDGDMAR